MPSNEIGPKKDEKNVSNPESVALNHATSLDKTPVKRLKQFFVKYRACWVSLVAILIGFIMLALFVWMLTILDPKLAKVGQKDDSDKDKDKEKEKGKKYLHQFYDFLLPPHLHCSKCIKNIIT